MALRVSYASSTGSLCTVIICAKDPTRIIRAGELLIGQNEASSVIKWRHICCAGKKIRQKLATYASGDEIVGYDTLTDDDKRLLENLTTDKEMFVPAAMANGVSDDSSAMRARAAAFSPSPSVSGSSLGDLFHSRLRQSSVKSPEPVSTPQDIWASAPSWDAPPPTAQQPADISVAAPSTQGQRTPDSLRSGYRTLPPRSNSVASAISPPASLAGSEAAWQAAPPAWDRTPPTSIQSCSIIDGSEKDASEADMTESVASDATQRESRNARTTLSGTYELKICAADIKVAQADVTLAEAQLKLGHAKKIVLERALTMANKKATSAAKAEATLTVSRAEVNVVEAEVRLAEAKLHVEVMKRAFLKKKLVLSE